MMDNGRRSAMVFAAVALVVGACGSSGRGSSDAAGGSKTVARPLR